jgi:Zn-dependent M28 family amino/carboxypeptidase
VQEVAVEEGRYKNIIARFGPQSGQLLVIGAHYDSHADARAEITDPRGYSLDTHTPGADDNASGVAGLLELARLLAREPQAQAIELVAYTLEEPPHFRTQMGSVQHARSLSAAKRKVRLMLSLEMIGYFSDEPGSQRYPMRVLDHVYPDRGNFIALVGRMGDFAQMREAKALMTGATDLPVHSINAPPLIPGIDFSDHRSYWAEGYPALMLTDTAFYRNRHYHQAGDTFEKLDYERMAKVVQSVYAVTQQRR